MGFSRQECWSVLSCPPPGIFLTQGSRVSQPLICYTSLSKSLHAKSLQSCSTLCDPMDSSPTGSSVHVIPLQMIFKSPLGPDPGLFPVLLLLSPWSNLDRSNLVLTKSLCWDAACSLFRGTQCFPSVWRLLSGVNGGCQVMTSGGERILPGSSAHERQMGFIVGSLRKDGEKPICLL